MGESSILSFVNAIIFCNQVFGIALPMILSKLGFGEGVDLGLVNMCNSITNLFITLAFCIVLERTILRELRRKDCFKAILCGFIVGCQQILSVINFGYVPPSTSSTVAMVIPIAVVFLDEINSFLSQKKMKLSVARSASGKGVAVLIWSCAAIVSNPNIYQGPLLFRLHGGGSTKPVFATARAPILVPEQLPNKDRSWAATVGAIALSFAGSAPIAAWCTNSLKEDMITPEISQSYLVATLGYLIGMILAGSYATYSDWDKKASELLSFTTLKVVDLAVMVISAGLTAWLTRLVQKKKPSYSAQFAYLYLVIEVLAIPLAVDGELHLRSLIGVVLLISGITVYNCWGTEAKASDDNDEEAGKG